MLSFSKLIVSSSTNQLPSLGFQQRIASLQWLFKDDVTFFSSGMLSFSPTGGGNGKPTQYICCENLMNCIKGQRDKTLKDESPKPKCPICYWGRVEENYQ